MIQKIFIFLTIALGTFPLLPLNFISILIILWTGLALINAYRKRYIQEFSILENRRYFWLIALIVPYIIYLPFADDFEIMGNILQGYLPLLAFSIGFVLNKKTYSNKHIHYLFNTLIISMILTNLKGWISIFEFGLNEAWSGNNFYSPLLRNFFSESTDIHPPYLGLLSVLAAIILLFRILNTSKFLLPNGLGILFLLCSTYVYTARMAMLGFVICAIFLIWRHFTSYKIKTWSVILGVLALLSLWFSPLKERIRESIAQEWVLPHQGQQPNEVNFRYGILYCSGQIIHENFLFGVNPDKVQQSLNNCYSQYTYSSYDDFTKINYNTHNQYIDFTIKFGVLGGLFLIVVLFCYFRNGHLLYQTFVLLIAFTFLTENIIDRQIGMVTYALFNALFIVFSDSYKGFLESE
ncbi:MAG: O-antigen ligase family protein [Bacteroidota bacterium]|nr:O-antigen ligase family protein [Bacteroidota bacterium]